VNGEPVRIRPYQPDDLGALYDICLRTADDGGDGTALFRDPKMPGHLYAGPYAAFEPSLAFVAEDPDGVAGYTLGVLDTRAFEERLDRDWWPALRAKYPQPGPDAGLAGLSVPERHTINVIHKPWATADELATGYPSHLHIDLLPRTQGRGIGRRLITMMISVLRDLGSPGLHLHVSRGNQKAAGFYRHLGFTEYPATDVDIFIMDLRGDPGIQP
jgi:ribosomal protein S18 acetylase RimI-like enzyme